MKFREVEGPGGSGNCHTKVSGAAEREVERGRALGNSPVAKAQPSPESEVPGEVSRPVPGAAGAGLPEIIAAPLRARTHTHRGPWASPLPQNNKEQEPGERAASRAGSGRLRRRGRRGASGGAGGTRGRRAGGGTYQAGSLGPGAVLLLPLVFHVCISLMVLMMTWGIPRGARGSGAETMTQ